MIAGHARAVVRILLIAAVTVAICTAWLPFRISARNDRRSDLRWRSRFTRHWCRAVVRLLGMRVDVRGAPPAAPFMLVTNHLSYVDIVLLGSIVEGVFVAKEEVSRWPVIGKLSHWSGAFYVDRRRNGRLIDVVAHAREVLAHGIGLVIFPEGTTTAGDRLLPFRPALLEPAVLARVPVWHACIEYASWEGSPPAEEAICWWRDMTFPKHLYGILQLPGFDATVRIGDAPHYRRDRKELARVLWAAVDSERRGETALEAS